MNLTLRTAHLIRFPTDTQTPGVLSVEGLFVCKSLELPWRENQSDVSCIPVGRYHCRWTFSPTFQKYTYEVQGVPKRWGIRIHPANYSRQLKGCIALGNALKDLDLDGNMDVLHSGKTVENFAALMLMKEFLLIIENANR